VDDDETHFVDISGSDKIYENVKQPPKTAKRRPNMVPDPPACGPFFFGRLPSADDGPEIYARLVALVFTEVHREGSELATSLPIAKRQLEELLGLDERDTRELRLDIASRYDDFSWNCAKFCEQITLKLRQTRAQSYREYNFAVTRLNRILDRLKSGTLVPAGLSAGSGLHHFFFGSGGPKSSRNGTTGTGNNKKISHFLRRIVKIF